MYLQSYNKEAKTTLKSNIDFIITGQFQESKYSSEPSVSVFMISLCDIGVNIRGVLANFNSVSEEKHIKLKYYEDISKEYIINDVYRCTGGQDSNWQYKTCKSKEYVHGLVYNKKLINNCIIDYVGSEKYKLLNRYINDKLHIPMTEEILELIDDKNDLFPELIVWSRKETNIKAYYINNSIGNDITHRLRNTELPLNKSNMDRWDSINTVNDYVLEFNKEIQSVLNKSIRTRFDAENELPDMRMFEYNMKPYRGQVGLIESAKRTLLDEKRVIITADMGCGKTLLGTMANDLYMQEKGNNGYITLVVAPNSTLKKWAKEIKNILGDKVNTKICESTVEYIRYMKSYANDKPLYIITSKETAKLGFKRKSAVNYGTKFVTVMEENEYGRKVGKKYKIKDLALCPKCGMPMANNAKGKDSDVEDEYLREKHFNSIKKSNYKCPNCAEVLWSVSYVKTAKTSLTDYCHRKNIKFDSCIFDEFHNERNITSATGNMFGNILKMSNVKILLSGTMNNGNVSSVFPLLMRLIPHKMFKDGYTMQDMDKFIKAYGSLKAVKVIKDDEQKATSRTMFKDSDFSEIAGINPIVYTRYLADITISATMDDLGIDMVDYTEYPIEVDMEGELSVKYHHLSEGLKRVIPYNYEMYNSTVIRHFINNPFGWNEINVKDAKGDIHTFKFPNMDSNKLLYKEDILIELVQNKLKENKKSLVFTDFTGGNSKYQDGEIISDRLCRILTEQGIKAKVLKASIKPMDRMDYINKNNDTEVWITNPILVKEGLDLIEFPIIVFYDYDFEPLKIQQASRRAWRSIQTVDCETYYFYYKDSIEEKIIKSITLKKMEMSAIEGRYNIDDFNLVKRTASALGAELYQCINVQDSMGKLNKNQVKSKNIEVHPSVQTMYL